MKKSLSAVLFAVPFCTAWAHPGHEMGAGSHWHATDAFGLAIGVAGALLVLWSAGRK